MRRDPNARVVRRALVAFGISSLACGAGLGALAGYADKGRFLSAVGWSGAPLVAVGIVGGTGLLVLALGAARGRRHP
ncbi:MAG TPA: hypothetical protein VHH36_07885 [Candidatus Thermoplasmatota archaeon]|nr:hypothetical protein [Candidatus Thermoplasmatota archaeon]